MDKSKSISNTSEPDSLELRLTRLENILNNKLNETSIDDTRLDNILAESSETIFRPEETQQKEKVDAPVPDNQTPVFVEIKNLETPNKIKDEIQMDLTLTEVNTVETKPIHTQTQKPSSDIPKFTLRETPLLHKSEQEYKYLSDISFLKSKADKLEKKLKKSENRVKSLEEDKIQLKERYQKQIHEQFLAHKSLASKQHKTPRKMNTEYLPTKTSSLKLHDLRNSFIGSGKSVSRIDSSRSEPLTSISSESKELNLENEGLRNKVKELQSKLWEAEKVRSGKEMKKDRSLMSKLGYLESIIGQTNKKLMEKNRKIKSLEEKIDRIEKENLKVNKGNRYYKKLNEKYELAEEHVIALLELILEEEYKNNQIFYQNPNKQNNLKIYNKLKERYLGKKKLFKTSVLKDVKKNGVKDIVYEACALLEIKNEELFIPCLKKLIWIINTLDKDGRLTSPKKIWSHRVLEKKPDFEKKHIWFKNEILKLLKKSPAAKDLEQINPNLMKSENMILFVLKKILP
eukprot:snap_masked-scaffold_14-processed-gene-5.56-mRNA-1 protein AED:1.00 eAED:1.00 QI:0/-1/0/0/-1/1/1/0/514